MFNTLGCLLLDSSALATTPAGAIRKLVNRRLAGQRLLTWVLRRASEAQRLGEIVVILSPDMDVPEVRAALPSDVRVHVSHQSDSLGRMRDCLSCVTAEQEHAPQALINLRLDCPLLDPCLLDRLVAAVDRDPHVDYATFCSRRGASLLTSQMGLFAEYISTDALDRLERQALAAGDREGFSSYLAGHPELFRIRLLPIPDLLDRTDVRLSIRHPDDWDHAEQIVEALGHDHLDWQRIIALIDRQPILRDRMAKLNHDEAHDAPAVALQS
jgi:spore coat polysaccharide biosynthesis protein SpsF (cytidylyltransferase family)